MCLRIQDFLHAIIRTEDNILRMLYAQGVVPIPSTSPNSPILKHNLFVQDLCKFSALQSDSLRGVGTDTVTAIKPQSQQSLDPTNARENYPHQVQNHDFYSFPPFHFRCSQALISGVLLPSVRHLNFSCSTSKYLAMISKHMPSE